MVCRQDGGTKGAKKFRGVRKRSWGRWVSEIREPHTQTRIWLGSFATPEMAARAYDVGLLYLRGPSAVLNFPDSPSRLPLLPRITVKSIQAAAAIVANTSTPPPDPRPSAAEPSLDRDHLPAVVSDRPLSLFEQIDPVATSIASELRVDLEDKCGEQERDRQSQDNTPIEVFDDEQQPSLIFDDIAMARAMLQESFSPIGNWSYDQALAEDLEVQFVEPILWSH